MVILCNVFSIINYIASAYLGHGECRGPCRPVGRRERWDTAGTVWASAAVRGAGMNLLELILFLRRQLLAVGRSLVQEAAVEI